MNYLTRIYRGRLNRSAYLTGILLCFVLIGVEGLTNRLIFRTMRIPNNSTFSNVLIYLDLVPVIFFSTTFYARRLHDIGASAKWLLLFLVPLVAPIMGVLLLLFPGEQVTNNYGSPPSADLDLWALVLGEKDPLPINQDNTEIFT